MKKATLIFVTVMMILSLLLISGCKSDKFNITGNWSVTTNISGQSFVENYSFVGDERSGEVLYQNDSLGTYAVNGDQISFTLRYYDADDDFTVEVYTGYFDDDHTMSGEFTYSVEGYQTLAGTWVAYR